MKGNFVTNNVVLPQFIKVSVGMKPSISHDPVGAKKKVIWCS